jgi:hypothetical protein
MTLRLRLRALALAPLLLGTAAGAQGRTGTDLWLIPTKMTAATIVFGMPRNATARAGYDNQPSFTPSGDALLYTVIGKDEQAEIWQYDLATRATRALTRTPESEYSATVTPDGAHFSVIRVEADSTQRLWEFPLDGRGAPALVLKDIQPVGYHLWAAPQTLVLYVLGGKLNSPTAGPATLQIVDVRTGAATVVARNIGRALAKVPGRDVVTFLQQVPDSGSWITELDLRTKQTTRLVQPPRGADYHVWAPNGMLLAGAGSKLYSYVFNRWVVSADLAAIGVHNISRLALSPRGDFLAFVAEDGATP